MLNISRVILIFFYLPYLQGKGEMTTYWLIDEDPSVRQKRLPPSLIHAHNICFDQSIQTDIYY